MTGVPATVTGRHVTAAFTTRTVVMSTASAVRDITSSFIATRTCQVTLAATTRTPGIGVSARAKAGSMTRRHASGFLFHQLIVGPNSLERRPDQRTVRARL